MLRCFCHFFSSVRQLAMLAWLECDKRGSLVPRLKIRTQQCLGHVRPRPKITTHTAFKAICVCLKIGYPQFQWIILDYHHCPNLNDLKICIFLHDNLGVLVPFSHVSECTFTTLIRSATAVTARWMLVFDNIGSAAVVCCSRNPRSPRNPGQFWNRQKNLEKNMRCRSKLPWFNHQTLNMRI